MTDAAHTITWGELCADPSLQDLPYKVELNGLNQIILVPTSPRHTRRQTKIVRWLNRLLEDGEVHGELAVMTSDNVKVPDVVWASEQTARAHDNELDEPWSSAPELCVEVLSPSNRRLEIEQKRAVYFQAGAREVWVCGLEGAMEFYRPDGQLARSELCPEFPMRVEI